ncbi:hypothetical protein GWK47_019078 [Chionoecetes opilio]|uniref:Uncharacterized protein n=1 Tax=Chionoecetes opilio TaxID=41210 RepID=A0A8J4XUS5_CHIOP|nr:hypothetical protein GWK47_019078 [Chionoecetes opilio]
MSPDDGFCDIPLDDTSDDDGNGLSSPLVETSDSPHHSFSCPPSPWCPENPCLDSGQPHPSLPALLWFANLAWGPGGTGCVAGYGAVVPLLEDTVPFLGGLFSGP